MMAKLVNTSGRILWFVADILTSHSIVFIYTVFLGVLKPKPTSITGGFNQLPVVDGNDRVSGI